MSAAGISASARAATTIREALGLWRGPALADVPAPITVIEAYRLAELRPATMERLVDLEPALGRHAMQADALNSLGWCQAHVDDYHRALVSCRLALAMLEECGDRQSAVRNWRRVLDVLDELGHPLADRVRDQLQPP